MREMHLQPHTVTLLTATEVQPIVGYHHVVLTLLGGDMRGILPCGSLPLGASRSRDETSSYVMIHLLQQQQISTISTSLSLPPLFSAQCILLSRATKITHPRTRAYSPIYYERTQPKTRASSTFLIHQEPHLPLELLLDLLSHTKSYYLLRTAQHSTPQHR